MKYYEIENFSILSDTLKDEIHKHAKLISFKKKEALFSSEDTAKNFYIFLSGKVKIYQYNAENSREQTISILGHGDMFDAITLLDGKIHEISSEVLEDGKALCLPIEKVRGWIHTNSDFNKIFFPYLATQIRKVEELATDLSLHNTSKRLIKLIVNNLAPIKKEPAILLQNLSHNEIASLIGTVRHVVDRHINELKSSDTIETKKRGIVIKDAKKLLEQLNISH